MTASNAGSRSQYRFMSVRQVLSKAVEIYAGNFGRYLRIITFFMIPLSVLTVYFGESWQALIPLSIAGILPQIGVIALTHRLFTENQEPSFIDDTSLSGVGQTVLRVVIAGTIAMALVLLIGAAPLATMLPILNFLDMFALVCAPILIVPGLMVAAGYQFVIHSIVLRGQGVIDSLKYSSRVTSGHLGHVIRLLLLFALIISLPSAILGEFISPYEALITPFFATLAGIFSTVAFLNLEPMGVILDSNQNGAKVERLVELLEEDGFEWQAVETPDEVAESIAELKRDEPGSQP